MQAGGYFLVLDEKSLLYSSGHLSPDAVNQRLNKWFEVMVQKNKHLKMKLDSFHLCPMWIHVVSWLTLYKNIAFDAFY